MMTVHKLSAGDGYRYYTGEVASADTLRDKNRELGDYYTVEGMPPGQWAGHGAQELALSGTVTEEQMATLFSGQQLPYTTEELTQLLAQKPDKSEFVYRTTMEAKRVEYAEKAWEIYAPLRSGMNQETIGHALGVGQRAISKRISFYGAAGNDFTKTTDPRYSDPQELPELKEQFIANYIMSEAEASRADTTARNAVQKAGGLTSKTNAETPHTYEGEPTQLMQRISAETARFIRLNNREPEAHERKEITNRVSGELFRTEHKREPRNHEEFKRWVNAQRTPKQQTVAGFDLVFTPTKSVSMAWGLGDENLRKGIETAHEKAIQDVIEYLEQNAVYTRRGANGITQENVKSGLIATKFRHYDSREGDPNLHDHLVVANKVQGQDGRWLSLDGRMLYSYGVAASELYNTRIAQHIHDDLGLEFVGTKRKGRMIYELVGFDSKAIQAFSSRRSDITEQLEILTQKFTEEHGYAPNLKQRQALQQQATLATRPTKDGVHSLAELNQMWRAQVKDQGLNIPVGSDLTSHLKDASTLHAHTVTADIAQAVATPEAEHAQKIIERLETQRSTWKRTHIEAETQRYFRDITSGAGLSDATVRATISAVVDQSVSLNNFGERVQLPETKLRADGTSVYRRADYELFSSTAIFDAENSLIRAATTEKVIPVATADTFTTQRDMLREALQASGKSLTISQEEMARAFLTDERLLVVGIGPAGAGKTTSSRLTVSTAQASGARVYGLAPTAAAASVMSGELGISADTIDNFLIGKQASKLQAGDMILVDEIGMVSTPALKNIVDAARENGAVVRGIGDYRQLAAIGSGGALRLIERQAGAVYLEDVFRFQNPAEAEASLALRETPLIGEDKPFAWYLDNDRIIAGVKETMLQDAFTAWASDTAEGKTSLMIASSNTDVKTLNEYAQTARIDAGDIATDTSVLLENTSRAYVGDTIVTRRNNRALVMNQGKDFVKNGDLWDVRAIKADGSLVVADKYHHGVITLPADYVKQNVELGYASTIYRAQGATVDTTHAVVDETTDRAGAYVAASRGRETNKLYVATTEEHSRDDVLEAIAGAYDRNLSFHEETQAQRTAERNVAASLAKYDDLATYASEEAMKTVAVKALGAEAAHHVYSEPAWGALAHELADTYREGLDPVETLSRAYYQRELGTAQDVAAVLQWRVKDVRSHDAQVREKFTEDARPFSQIPDENLDKLIAQAKKQAKPLAEMEIEDTRWNTREYALVKNEKLREMISNSAKALDANEYSDPMLAAQIKENMSLMQAEVSRRRWASPEQKHVEEIVRGDRKRSGHSFTLLHGLQWEKKIRDEVFLPASAAREDSPERITKGVSGYSLDSFWQYDQFTPESLRPVLKAQHREVADLVQLRGQQIAAEAPAWVQSLGEVPANARNARHWYRVAAEVEAFREKYNVPVSEQETVPKSLIREGNRGDFLATQVVNVHKRSRLSSTLSNSAENKLSASGAEIIRHGQEKPSEAEKLIGKKSLNTGEASEEKGEHMQQIDDLWSQLESAYQAEKQARAELVAAQRNVENAQASYQSAVHQQEVQAQQLVQRMNSDYAPVQVAQQRVEEASFFTRGSRERDLEAAQQNFKTQYGISELPTEEDRSWMLNVPEYAQLNHQVESLQAHVESSQTDVERAQVTFDTAHNRREDAYTEYAQVRDSEPSTAIVSEDMTPAQIKQLRSSRLHVDESLLSAGVRPNFTRAAAGNDSTGDTTEEPSQAQRLTVRELHAQVSRQEQQRQDQSWDEQTQRKIDRGLSR